MKVNPFCAWGSDLVRVPITWEDDEWCLRGADPKDIKTQLFFEYNVFNFHPIHIFLNTENFLRYESVKEKQMDVSYLKRHRNLNQYGVRDAFLEVLKYAM